MKSPELQSNIEASPESLGDLVTCMVQEAERIQDEASEKGSFEKILSNTESLKVKIRPQGSDYPIIEDWLTQEPMPNMIANCLYVVEGLRNIHEPTVAYEERIEVHIASHIGRLMARKREYTYEQPYLPAVRRLRPHEANREYERLKERQRLQIVRLPRMIAFQEQMGTNRVTEGDVLDLQDMLLTSFATSID